MSRWGMVQRPDGTIAQAGLPKITMGSGLPTDVRGLKLRAVVLQVYTYDERGSLIRADNSTRKAATYVDVLTYGKWRVPLRAMVTRPRAGLHDGDIWIPRPTTMSIAGNPIGDTSGLNAAELDGDHVIVEFLEGDPSLAVITGCLDHPSADAKRLDAATAYGVERLRPVRVDARPPGSPAQSWRAPRGVRHQGGFFGIDADGAFVVDLTRAHLGELDAQGRPPRRQNDPSSAGDNVLTEDGAGGGNIRLRLRTGSTLELEIDGTTLKLEAQDGDAKLTLGDGAVSLAVAEHLEALYGSLRTEFTKLVADFNALVVAYNLHLHGPPVPPPDPLAISLMPGLPSTAAAPAWDGDINSDKLKLPDTG